MPPATLDSRCIGQSEIDLAFELIDSCNEYTNLVADREAFARAPADQTVARSFENVKVVGER